MMKVMVSFARASENLVSVRTITGVNRIANEATCLVVWTHDGHRHYFPWINIAEVEVIP